MMGKVLVLFLITLSAAVTAGAQDLPRNGSAYLAEGDNVAAAKSYTDLLRLNPFDPVALNNLAVAKAAAGDYQAAVSLLTRSAKLAPNRADIRENLVRMQRWMDTYGGARLASMGRPRQPTVRTGTVFPEPPPLWGGVSRTGSSPLSLPASTR